MASAYINITSTASRISSQARSAIDALQQVKNNFASLKASLDQIALGGDYTALAGYLGVTASEAESLYALWGSANGELQAAGFIAQLLARCG